MNLVKSIEQYNDKNTFFCEPIKNNIMNEGNFIRILYSTQHFILNGIYLFINLQDITCEKFYSKYKCNFNISVHKEIIDKLKQIEEQLLKKYNTNKMASYKIYEQLKSGFIKIFTDVGNRSQCSFILKISGIWETQYNYGLTYKFLKVS
jgi:Zn-dependent M16 (insulinase) family peptidase